MTPVDLHLFSGRGFKSSIGNGLFALSPKLEQIVADNGDFAVKAVFCQMLQHHRAAYGRILLQKFFD